MPSLSHYPLIAIVIAAPLTGALHFDIQPIPLDTFDASALATKFLSLTLVALAIERAVEIYMSNRFTPDVTDGMDAAKLIALKTGVAARASLAMSLVLSLVGIRLLAQIAPVDALAPLQARCFHIADIVLTTLLLSGGADGMHQMLGGVLRKTGPRL